MNPADMTRATESGSKDYCWECKHWIWDCTCYPSDVEEADTAKAMQIAEREGWVSPMPDGLDCPVAPLEGDE